MKALTHFNTIETNRTELRLLTPVLVEELFAEKSEKELLHYFGMNEIEDLLVEKEKFKSKPSTDTRSYCWFLIALKENQHVIGACGFHTWYIDHDRAEIGYSLYNDQHKGKGIMTEVIERILQFGFEEMKLHRVEALVGPDNVPSLKLMDNFGFQKEGLLREHYKRNGNYEDSVAFSLLKNEWTIRHSVLL